MTLFELEELFLSLFISDELGRNRVREDHDPGWQEELTSWDEDEEGEWNELDEIFLHLGDLHTLFICFSSIPSLESLPLCLDSPLTIPEQCLESMDGMDYAMFKGLPANP